MGESAKILNPEDRFNAGYECGLSDGTYGEIETIKKVRSEYDDLAVVCYINSTAALKEYSDVSLLPQMQLRL